MVIVGSGLAGSVLAHRLGHHGVRVLVIERGDFLSDTLRQSEKPIGPYQSLEPRLRLVGGLTKFYGAAMCRMRESDFRAVSHESGESPAWPISYSELEPYYSDAERLFHVHGVDDPAEPPRSAAFPYPPLPHAPLVSALIDRLRQSGTSVSALPRAIDYGAGGACVLCPTCDAYYCHRDAKFDADIAALRPALTTGFVELMTGAACVRITTDGSDRATGVIVQREGKSITIGADVVAVSAGVPHSARLLIASRNSTHPHGLGNSSGCVGRYLAGHTAGMIFPILGARQLPEMHTKTFAVNTFYDGAPGWPYPVGVIQAAGQLPFWEHRGVPRWLRPAAKLIGQRSIYCFYMTEALPTPDSGYGLDSDAPEMARPPLENLKTFARLRRAAIDLFTRAGYRTIAPRRRTLWHEVGTVRFGTDPATSVLDPSCRVRDVHNLFVVDASVFPSAGAVNTGLTIAALALRTADFIAGKTRTRADRRSGDAHASVH